MKGELWSLLKLGASSLATVVTIMAALAVFYAAATVLAPWVLTLFDYWFRFGGLLHNLVVR